MTGYGRGVATAGGIRVEVELSTVNRKQFDARLNLPRSLAAVESRILEQIQTRIARGQVTGTVLLHVSGAARQRAVRLDTDLAAVYVQRLRQAARRLGLRDDLSAGMLLGLPDVLHSGDVEENPEALWPLVSRALGRALERLAAMRSREGRVLAADLRRRFARLGRALARIRALAPGVMAKRRKTLTARLSAAGLNTADETLRKELVLFAERADIAEELTRLASHLRQAASLFRACEPAGRTLDFLVQEMLREINTIGAKANDLAITRQVIVFKTELERIREQVQNVE